MARGPHVGYIYAIEDPMLPAEAGLRFIYVGVSHQPWLAVKRIITRPPIEMVSWVESLRKAFPEGLMVYGSEICRLYHGDSLLLPEIPRGLTLLNWKILDYEEEEFINPSLTLRVANRTKRSIWIDRLRQEGHPLRNAKIGRKSRENAENTHSKEEIGVLFDKTHSLFDELRSKEGEFSPQKLDETIKNLENLKAILMNLAQKP